MKQKRKLGRKLLGFLLTLAMVVGLMPEMGLTVYADNTETLLTTITAVGTSNGYPATSANVKLQHGRHCYPYVQSVFRWIWTGIVRYDLGMVGIRYNVNCHPC